MSSMLHLHPSQWEIDHRVDIMEGQAYEAEHGELPATPFWRFLEHRHSLNPARFDHWHPLSGYLIEHQGQPHPGHRTPHGWISYMRQPPAVPVCPVEPPPCVPIHVGPQVVPEPPSIVLAGVVVAAWVITAVKWGWLAMNSI